MSRSFIGGSKTESAGPPWYDRVSNASASLWSVLACIVKPVLVTKLARQAIVETR